MDRRVRRSVQLLKKSFSELMAEKGFVAISVQDITERADVNRSTFYAHFPDKFALLEAIICEHFQCQLAAKLPAEASWRKSHLRILIQATLTFFGYVHGQCHPSEKVEPLFRRAVQKELAIVLLDWLKRTSAADVMWSVPKETIAALLSWAIFGAAMEWYQGELAFSLEQMTTQILTVVSDGVVHLTPHGLPE